MTRTHTRTAMKTGLSLSALALVITGAVLYAGPLDPPAGPVTPTYKTLSEVEPRTAINAANTPGDADSVFRITAPGSYYLTGNITGEVGKHGIEIVPGTGGGITLDLNGFDLRGVAGSLDGVSVTTLNFRANFAVVNGSVRNWGGAGVNLATLFAINSRVEGILASGNTGGGILSFQASTISNCSAYLNGGTGISAGFGSTVADCTAQSNSLDGIACQSGCVVRGNNCSANGNGTGDGAGIHATGADNRIEGNNCIGADRGIDVDSAGNIIIRNTCSGSTTNWDVVAGNVILVITATAAPAVNGNSGGVAPGSTDPSANFSY
jgi:parallel beta-helix repeat protein